MLTASFFITFYTRILLHIPLLLNFLFTQLTEFPFLNSPLESPFKNFPFTLLRIPFTQSPDCFFRKAIPFYTNPLREESPFLHDCLRNLFVVQNSPILKSTPSLTISKKDFIEPCSLICVTLFLVMIIAQNTIIVNHFIHFFLTKIHIFRMDIQI